MCVASCLAELDRPVNWKSARILALALLSIFGSVISFSAYYWLLGKMHAYQLSTINLVVPIVAMAEGALLLRERLPLLMVGAAIAVLVSVAAVLRAEDDKAVTLGIEFDAR